MVLEYSDDKHCIAYRDFVDNPEDRTAQKKFNKVFNSTLMSPAVKLDLRLKSAANARIFNQQNQGDNAINLLSGQADKDNLVLKVRIKGAYRKFFHFSDATLVENKELCTKKMWEGQFDRITDIYIFEINKHDYSKV